MEKETRVYIAQLKCPANHCVVAVAGEFNSFEEAAAMKPQVLMMFAKAVADKILNPECGICHSSAFQVDIGITRFRSKEEAMPELVKVQADQMATALLLKQSRN